MITIGRRQFLHNAGRLMLLPLFQGVLSPETAAAATKTGSWVHLYFPMGCFQKDWSPVAGALKIPDFLNVMAPIQKNLLWFGDVGNNFKEEGLGSHEQALGSSISCAPQMTNGNIDKCYNTSADQVMAKAWKETYPNGAMTLARAGFQAASDCCHPAEAGLNYTSWLEPGKNTPTISNPATALQQFFSSGKKADNVASTLADGKSTLDYFTSQVTAAKGMLGKDDAARLDQYTEAMREYEKKAALALSTQAQCKLDTNLGNSADFFTHQNTMFDLIALALQCNVTPAITYVMDFEFSFQSYDKIGVNSGFHNVTHHSPGDKDMIESHRKINAHYASQFSKLVQAVSKMVNAQGDSLLNDVIISVGSGMSDSNDHNRGSNIPMVWAGGAGLGVPQDKLYSPPVTMSEVIRSMMTYTGLPEATVKAYGQGEGNLIGKLKAL